MTNQAHRRDRLDASFHQVSLLCQDSKYFSRNFDHTSPKIWRARAFPYTNPSILTLKKSVKIKLTAVIPFLLRLLKWITGGTLYHGIVRSVTGCRERAILRNENSP